MWKGAGGRARCRLRTWRGGGVCEEAVGEREYRPGMLFNELGLLGRGVVYGGETVEGRDGC